MTDTATSRTLVIEREMPHPPEKIWRALTEGRLIGEWLMQNDFQPVVGHRFQFRSTPVPGWNGIIDSRSPGGRTALASLLRLDFHGPGDRRHLDVDSHRARHAPAHGAIRLPVRRRRELQRCKIRLDQLHQQTRERRRRFAMTAKTKSIVYWTTTILVAFFMTGGVAQLAQYRANPHGVVPELGYPMYFFAILGIWKVLGAIAILVPRLSPPQGMGLRRHLLRPHRRCSILRLGRRLRRLRISHHRPSRHRRPPGRIVGAPSSKPHHRHPLSSQRRTAGRPAHQASQTA